MTEEKQAGSDKDAGQSQQGQPGRAPEPELRQPEALDVKDAGAGIGSSATETGAPPVLAGQTFAPAAPAPAGAPAMEPAQPSVGEHAAALIRDQIDILVLRIYNDAQELLETGAAPPDPVTIRTVLETMAASLEKSDARTFAYTYSRTSRPALQQINDQVLPLSLGLQIGGIFEAILRDAFNEGFTADPALRSASVGLLAQMAAPAKRALLGEPGALVQWQAPG